MKPVLILSMTLLRETNENDNDSLLSKYTNKVSSVGEIVNVVNKLDKENKLVIFLNVKEGLNIEEIEEEIKLALNTRHEEIELYIYSNENFENLKLSFEDTLNNSKIDVCNSVDQVKKIEYISKIQGFDVFSMEQLENMAKYICIRNYDKDEYLFKTGDKNNSIFFVIEGKLNVVKYSNSGYEILIGNINEHEVIGETSFVNDVYDVNAVVAEKATIASIKKDEIQSLFSEDVDFETKVLKLFIDKLHKKLGNLNNLHSNLVINKNTEENNG